MGKTVALDRPHLEFARRQFTEYYRHSPSPAPLRCARREFAWFPFATETLMRRHLTLPSPESLSGFLAEEVPRHVYYSAAYYRDPDHPKMDGKGWLGADLIFDLDADHLKGAEHRDYAGQLELVREALERLLDDFLFTDFGVDESQTRVVFSGGRGYHVHVFDERFQRLNSPERRELVEYLQGTGLDPEFGIQVTRETDRGAAGALELSDSGDGGASRRSRAPGFRRLYPPDAPGWRGRSSRAVLAMLARWERQGSAATSAELERLGVSKGRARNLARQLVDEGRARQIRETLSLDVYPGGPPPELLQLVIRQASVEVQGETDAPVTTDIHRLIRLPGSLHGGTGFRVQPIPRNGLREFSPLRDARLADPPGRLIPLTASEKFSYPFEPAIAAAQGEAIEAPPSVALFLILLGEAELRTSS